MNGNLEKISVTLFARLACILPMECILRNEKFEGGNFVDSKNHEIYYIALNFRGTKLS